MPASPCPIRFCTSRDGVRIAYAVTGRGPPLLKTANWLSHLEHDWESPIWRPWWEEIGKHFTLVRYDQRGCGLSDRDVRDISLEAWVADLEAVADAVGFPRFMLFGLSQGGAISMAYAARHPERVTRLMLCGAYAEGRYRRDPSADKVEAAKMLLKLIELGWGTGGPAFRQVFTAMIVPDATAEQQRAFDELQSLSTSSRNAVRILDAFNAIDVAAEAQRIASPTLVVHSNRDCSISYEAGRRVAALIPGARFVTVDSRNHVLLSTEPAWRSLMEEMRAFGSEAAPEPQRAPDRRVEDMTARERELLELIAQGLGNGEIARRLSLSGKTVRNHVTSIFAKLQVETRAQAIVVAREMGFGRLGEPS